MTDPAAAPELLVVGHIAKAHGTKGELFVWPLTDNPEHVFAAGRELLIGSDAGAVEPGAAVVAIESVRPFKRGFLVQLEGLEDRDHADALARRYLLLPRQALPPLEEDEIFYHELLDMLVETLDGEAVGRVREVYETEPHHLLEVIGDDGRMRLVPFAQRIVRVVDREKRRLVIDPPEGLLDL